MSIYGPSFICKRDEVLEILAGTSPEYANGFSNHGPMAAESLCYLNRQDAAINWAKSYRKILEVEIVSVQQIDKDDWQNYLGKRNYFYGWKKFFEDYISSINWQTTIQTWTPRLIPGIVSAAAHGVLRTAHAVRSLENKITSHRIEELASGLAYWASTYQTLPQAPFALRQASASQIAPSLYLIPKEQRTYHNSISSGLKQLTDHPEFSPVINMLDTSSGFHDCLDDILQTFVRIYLANAEHALISAVHAVTGPATLQILGTYLTNEQKTLALRYAWQASAAIHSANDLKPPLTIYEGHLNLKEHDELIDDAVNSKDEHAIKFTEVCLRLANKSKNSIYNYAAHDATSRLL